MYVPCFTPSRFVFRHGGVVVSVLAFLTGLLSGVLEHQCRHVVLFPQTSPKLNSPHCLS